MEFLHCKTVIQEMSIFLILSQRQCSLTVKGMGSGTRLLGSSSGLTSYWLCDLRQVASYFFKIDFGERGSKRVREREKEEYQFVVPLSNAFIG